jgi:hypothetical protein
VLNTIELGILDGCANHYELFYFPFAEVNYGGEVVRMSPEGGLHVSVPGEEVARHVRRLIGAGLMRCWRISDDPGDHGPFLTPEEQTAGLYRERVEVPEPGAAEFAAYRGYDCLTFDDHMERFGQGPHEFRITRAGIEELEKPIYDGLG